MDTTVVDHPIVQARLSVMRDEQRQRRVPGRAARTATLLVYEATRDLEPPT